MNTTQQDIQTSEPPADYRPLIDGEIIAEGDEFQYDTGDWRPTGCAGMTYKLGPRSGILHHAPHRRPAKAAKLKLWIHRGEGVYVGSLVIVCAESKDEAEGIIRSQLDCSGITNEPLNVKEADFTRGAVIAFDDGQY